MTTPPPAGVQPSITLPHEQAFELYHNAFSLCSMKVRLCLAELGVPYKSHHIDLIETGAYENVRSDFACINPGMTVPVLVHDGHPVYESHEQVRYAAARSPTPELLVPADASLEDEMNFWIDRSSLTDDPIANSALSAGNAVPGQTLPLFAAMIEDIPYRRIFEGFIKHFDKRRPLMFTMMKLSGMRSLRDVPMLRQAIRRSRIDMQAHLDALEAQLHSHGKAWILGNTFSLADVSWAVIFERLAQADALETYVNDDLRPACARYWSAWKSRSAYDLAIVQHEHPLVQRGTQRIRAAKAADPSLRQLLEAAEETTKR